MPTWCNFYISWHFIRSFVPFGIYWINSIQEPMDLFLFQRGGKFRDMNILGRRKEQDLLQACLESKRPEFLAVYGRRRTGKAYLVKEYFRNQFSFYATGVANVSTKEQLEVFGDTLKRFGCREKARPKNWIEAFSRMRDILESDNVKRDAYTGKRVVFLDELPWMDTARSDLKTGLPRHGL